MIENGLKLVSASENESLPITSPTRIKTANIGLQLCLYGLGESHVNRLSHLSRVIQELESRVFSEEYISELDNRGVLALYKLANDTMNNSANYVKDLLNVVKIKEIENTLLEMAAAQETDNSQSHELSEIASTLLKQLVNLKEPIRPVDIN